jgi:hypothetical protein
MDMEKMQMVCVGARLSLAALLYFLGDSEWLRVFAVLLFAIAAGFAIIYTFGLRKTGIETDGRPIWWNVMRPVHAFLYLLAAQRAFLCDGKAASSFVGTDALIGLMVFTSKPWFLAHCQ